MKKIISAIIAVGLLTSAFPMTAFAANGPSTKTFDNYYLAYLSAYNIETDTGYKIYNPNEAEASAPEGVSYDLASNTLTLDNVKQPDTELYANMMGDDFRITVNGECELRDVYVYGFGYGGSLTIDGSGTLEINQSQKDDIGIILIAEGSDSSLTIGEDVTLNVYGEKYAVFIDGTTYSNADSAFVCKNGSKPESLVAKRIEYDDNEYAPIIKIEEGWTRFEGYEAKNSSDPDGKYSVTIDEFEGEKQYTVHKFTGLDGYNVLVEDKSFEELTMTEEEFNSSEYSIVTDVLPVKIYYTNREDEKNYRGWRAKKVYNAEDPDGVYCAGYVWFGSGSTDRDPDEYMVYHLLWDEAKEAYVQDEEFGYKSLSAEEFAASPYEIVFKEVMSAETVSYWYYNDPDDENNFKSTGIILKSDKDPDGIYVKSGSFEIVESDGSSSGGFIIDELYYDAENDRYLRDPDSEFGTKHYSINYEDYDDAGFSEILKTVYVPEEIRYITDDYPFEDYALKGFRASNSGDPGAKYAARPYYQNNPGESRISGYDISRIVFDEAKGHYYEDESFNKIYVKADELEESGYSIDTENQPVEFYSSGMVDTYSMPIFTDYSGNRYLVQEGMVYDFSDDNMFDYFGDKRYIPVINEEVFASQLFETKVHIVTDYYKYYTDSKEFTYNGGHNEPAYILGDVNCDGKVSIQDATMIQYYLADLLAEPLSEAQLKAADYNKDGKVGIGDATAIQYFLADLV